MGMYPEKFTAIVRFSGNKDIHVYTIENAADAHKLLTMANVVWIQVITDTGHVIQPKVADQSKLDIDALSRPLRPKGAWMPAKDIKAEKALAEISGDNDSYGAGIIRCCNNDITWVYGTTEVICLHCDTAYDTAPSPGFSVVNYPDYDK
jgi:hypothetical protein